MRTRNKVVAAAVAGALLLGGGGTFALWQASGDFDGGNITAGDLAITTSDVTLWDVSADRSDVGHEITSDAWRIVPGDTVAFRTDANITLEGDNLVADLELSGFPEAVVSTVNPAYWEFTATVTYGEYSETETITVGTAPVTLATFAAPRAGQDAGTPTNTGLIQLDGTNNVATVEIVASFVGGGTAAGATDIASTTDAVAFADHVNLLLSQVRHTGA